MPKLNIVTTENIKEQVYDIITDIDIVKRETIANNKSFLYDLDMDSLDYLNIILECEKVFNISFNDLEIEKIFTVNDLIELIKEKNPEPWRTEKKQTRLQEFFSKFKRTRSIIADANTKTHTK